MNHFCLPNDLPATLTENLTRDELLQLVAPPGQHDGRQCDVIIRNYSAMTSSELDQLYSEDNQKNFTTEPCQKWLYYSDEFEQTTISEVREGIH